MKKILPIVITIILVAAGYYYFKLGGTEDIQFQFVEGENITIQAVHYEGRYSSNELEEIFVKMRDLSLEKELPLVVVNEGSDTEARELSQWIGVMLNEGDTVAEGLIFRNFSNINAVETVINAHNMVMPRPEDVLEKATEFAQSDGLTLSEFTIEIYYKEDSLKVLFPVERK